MSRIKLRTPAPDGETFAPTAFDSQIGKRIPTAGGMGELIAAQVTGDGRAADLTIELDAAASETVESAGGPSGPFSVGYK